MDMVLLDEKPCNLLDGTSVSEGPVVSFIRIVDGDKTFLWIGTCAPNRGLNIRLVTYAVGIVRHSAVITEKKQIYENERVSENLRETKLNSGRMRIIKRSLCSVEVAFIRVLNKLSGFSASVYFLYPRLGCVVIFIILLHRETTHLARAGAVIQYIEWNSKAIVLSFHYFESYLVLHDSILEILETKAWDIIIVCCNTRGTV
jgi:hypothetical protein